MYFLLFELTLTHGNNFFFMCKFLNICSGFVKFNL